MSEENESLHDEISALWEEASKESPEVVKEETVNKEPVVEPEKVDGKQTEDNPPEKVPEASDKTDDTKIEEEVTNKEPVLTQDKAPSGWSPKSRERWAEIPEDLRSEILRREEASAAGVRKLQEETAPMRGFVQALSPFINEAAQNARDPAQYIGNVMVTERVLRTGNPDQKFDALLGIADQYGIPLRQIINKSVGEEILKAPEKQQFSLPPEIQKELEESRRWREEQSRNTNTTQITQFAEKNEFFEDVRVTMANLLEAGSAKTLEEAYEQATWANPEIRSILMERQSKGGKEADLKNAQKRASSANVKNDESLGTRKAPKDDKDSSTEDDIRAAIAGLSGRD